AFAIRTASPGQPMARSKLPAKSTLRDWSSPDIVIILRLNLSLSGGCALTYIAVDQRPSLASKVLAPPQTLPASNPVSAGRDADSEVSMKVESILRAKGRQVTTIQPWAKVEQAIGQLMGPPKIGALVVTGVPKGFTGMITERDIIRGMK